MEEEELLVPPGADYGGLEGFVIDQNVLPQSNVTIQVEGLNRSVVTDAVGYYQIVPLEPGPYNLIVNHSGFLPMRRAATILAGIGLRLDFSLQQIPVPVPYIDDSYQRRGLIHCQARVNVTQNTNPDCAEIGQQHTAGYLPPGREANLTLGAEVHAVLLELEWRSSIATNDRLRLAVRPNEGVTWQQFEGPSVLRVEINQSRLSELSDWAQKDYRSQGGQMFFLVYAGETIRHSTGGAGLTLQQDYTLYVTVFYRMDVPEKYTRLAP